MIKKVLFVACFALIGATFTYASQIVEEPSCVPVTTSCQIQTIVCGDDIWEIIEGAIEADEVICP
ncbi:hypothetical protein [Mongoliitalea lutea]|uniref:Uncharacterized protein n=1 Tax=Mongoliitalea lutea TaxID=849756 RepID=A0A8J3CZI0_9BACT|nr:hypothetical protein [Mongoliitalea lutea]GHB49303.1 hypothetical protein GCM10008106_32640 [Mongoliitalea lutea]